MSKQFLGRRSQRCSFKAPRGSLISHIIIDGYNVIGVLHRHVDKAREDLVQLLIRYRAVSGHSITVVFDGYAQGPSAEQRSVRGNVEIIYTRLGESADDAIKRIIADDRREWIVVSSDRDVSSYAWSVGSVPIRSEVFMDAIQNRLSAEGSNSACHSQSIFLSSARREGDDEAPAIHKGNPRRQSRKERSLARILRKL